MSIRSVYQLASVRSLGTLSLARYTAKTPAYSLITSQRIRSSVCTQQKALYSQKSSNKGNPTTEKAPKTNAEDAGANSGYVLPEKYAKVLRSILSRFLPRYQAHNIGKSIYKSCSAYPDYNAFWIEQCKLPDSFQTWFSTSSLFVWMAMVRVRADPNSKYYSQELVNCFFRDAEKRIRATGIRSGRIVTDTLKDLASSFKGTVMSLDEGFHKSDAVLAAAIWRNLIPSEDAAVNITITTKYVRSQLSKLDRTKFADISAGKFSFDPIILGSEQAATTNQVGGTKA